MTREQVAQAAYQAGWRGDDLTKIVAIAYRESSGHFGVYVDRPSTGDWSYGLVGLNVGKPDASGQGPMWKSFYSKLDFLKSPDDLRDPVKNLMAAKALHDQSGWRPWGPYKGVSETTGTDLNAAHAAVDSAAIQRRPTTATLSIPRSTPSCTPLRRRWAMRITPAPRRARTIPIRTRSTAPHWCNGPRTRPACSSIAPPRRSTCN